MAALWVIFFFRGTILSTHLKVSRLVNKLRIWDWTRGCESAVEMWLYLWPAWAQLDKQSRNPNDFPFTLFPETAQSGDSMKRSLWFSHSALCSSPNSHHSIQTPWSLLPVVSEFQSVRNCEVCFSGDISY